jgi:NADPH:quinone reductase-like Zn-dependent oxidoreductase
VAKPAPKADEVLIGVRATSVTAGDCELRALRFSLGLRLLVRILMGLTRPRNKILGQEFAGDVEGVGSHVTRFQVGDRVYGTTGFRFGAYAEYLGLREASRDGAVSILPANVSYEEAATVPTGGLDALHFLRKAGNLRGRSVLIIGAGGGIGTVAVQLAKYFGSEVTGVDATGKMELLRSLGADHVVDYTREEVPTPGELYDVVFDVVGQSRFSECLNALRDGGRYLLANPSLGSMLRRPWANATSGKNVISRAPRPRPEDLDFLTGLIEAGRVRSIIDRRYPLEQVPEAHRYMDAGLARGSVVITL